MIGQAMHVDAVPNQGHACARRQRQPRRLVSTLTTLRAFVLRIDRIADAAFAPR